MGYIGVKEGNIENLTEGKMMISIFFLHNTLCLPVGVHKIS